MKIRSYYYAKPAWHGSCYNTICFKHMLCGAYLFATTKIDTNETNDAARITNELSIGDAPPRNTTWGRAYSPPNSPSSRSSDEMDSNRAPAELSNEVQRIIPAESGTICATWLLGWFLLVRFDNTKAYHLLNLW